MRLTAKTRPEERRHLSVVLVDSHFRPTLEAPRGAGVDQPSAAASAVTTARWSSGGIPSTQPTAWRPRVALYGTGACVSDSSLQGLSYKDEKLKNGFPRSGDSKPGTNGPPWPDFLALQVRQRQGSFW
jgi:hypothetical protein